MKQFKVLELYSGIGGMHFALKEAFPSGDWDVTASVDVNDAVNKVYQHNFPTTNNMCNAIEGFSLNTLQKLQFNVVLMSPPCQPFTRLGLKEDINDPRTRSFLHFIKLLPKLKDQVEYLLLENVKGFEESEAHKMLTETLKEMSFNYEGYLISPRHLGIPNSRLRYYLIAKRSEFVPTEHQIFPIISNNISTEIQQNVIGNCSFIKEYLEPNSTNIDSALYKNYKVPDDVVEKYLSAMDVVNIEAQCSTCFTKSYGQYVKATGSLLNLSNKFDVNGEQEFILRYFTPREVANLMCFPASFTFPDTTTKKQQYRMLGNSLNVKVVAYLLNILFL